MFIHPPFFIEAPGGGATPKNYARSVRTFPRTIEPPTFPWPDLRIAGKNENINYST